MQKPICCDFGPRKVKTLSKINITSEEDVSHTAVYVAK